MNRRYFLKAATSLPVLVLAVPRADRIMTVKGTITTKQLGVTLIHEHILVDFIGADRISKQRWDRAVVRKAVLPYLLEANARGVQSLLDCTPAFLGRDALLLREISEESGLHILTNTGYYGAVDNKYLPPWAHSESDEELARRWIREFDEGIEGTSVRPGFIKIGVNSGTLSPLHQKLVRAAAITHLKTGLTICSHTGPALPAFEEMEILRQMGVHPSAFVWVHAQNEKDKNSYLEATRRGAWVSLDGMGWGDSENYASWLHTLKNDQALSRVLVSHDAGWYRPDEVKPMEKFVGYTQLFDKVWPLLGKRGFGKQERLQLLVTNPSQAFGIQVRKL